MGSVRAALNNLRALGPREKCFTDFLSCASKGFVEANEHVSGSFPSVLRKGDAKGYGLFCGPRPARAGEVVLQVPPALWLPYCAEAAVRKAEAGAPDVLARVRSVCASFGGASASTMAPATCLALEILFTLERDVSDPYLGLLWDASRSAASLPHPLLMGPRHLDHLQASPLRESITTAVGAYSALHKSILGLGDDVSPSPERYHDAAAATPSASSTRDFLWALGVVLSRGVSEDDAGGAGLVPYLEFANHGNIPGGGPEGGGAGAGGIGDGGGGGPAVASCVRGFDKTTGSHYLRALRDIGPGEEFLIDYGSARKSTYKFVRSYGFVSAPPNASPGGSAGQDQRGSNSDSIRIHLSGPKLSLQPPPTSPSPPIEGVTSAKRSETKTFGGIPGACESPVNHSRMAGEGDASGHARRGGRRGGSDSSPENVTQPGPAASSEGSDTGGTAIPSFAVELKLGEARNALESLVSLGGGVGSAGTFSATAGAMVGSLSAEKDPAGVADDAAESAAAGIAASAASAGGAKVAVSTAAAAAAAATPSSATTPQETARRATIAAAAADAAEMCAALDERLRRYSTTLEQDLEVLRRFSFEEEQEQAQEQEREEAASPRAVTNEWVKTCVSVRAAEKVALRRALHEISSSIL